VSPVGDSGPAEIRRRLREDASFELDDARMRDIVRDLHRVRPPIFWFDLLATVLLGWGSFAAALVLRPFSIGMLACVALAAFALYRALCFLHEISHQNHRTLSGFETAWNLLVGYPLLMPSFVYVGVHQSHHKLTTYGTSQDPEYLPFAHNSRMTAVFALEGFFIPAVLLVRFLLLAPIGFLFPRFGHWLVTHLSSLTMNVLYRREASPELIAKIRRHSLAICLLWAVPIALAAYRVLPWRFFAIWFVVTGLASFVNTLRTLGAHAYESSGEPLDRVGQLIDSIDTPGAFWTELWAPVGLRYHALHHYFPGIPYHNLAEAYRRLISTLPIGSHYSRMSNPSLQHSLRTLYKKGLRAWS
jgi:fatty acid desaturase